MHVRDVEFIIVGAGIMGVATAFFLSESKREVLLIDRKGVGEEASGRNAGSLSLQNKPYQLIPLCREGIRTWRELDQEIGGLGFVQPGGFRVAETEEEYFFLAKDLKERNRYGLGIVQMPIEEVRRIAPYVSDSLKGANYCLWDGYVDARVATQRIALAARSRGVEIVTNNAVIKIKWKNRSCIFVITEKQQYRCHRLLIAAGVWTRQLGRFLDLDLPLNLRINQMVVTSRYPRLIEHMITHARGHLTLKQLDCGSILIGGGWPGAGDLSQDIKRPRYESIVGNVAVAVRVVPELAPIEAIRTWAGFDGRTNDELPILGPVPEKGNVFLATGCFGGYVAGPYIGKLMAQMMIGQKPEMSIDAFSVRRFS